MKSVIVFTLLIISLLMSSCVQKTYKRTVMVTLDVSKVENIESVGIRGNGKPLSWENDYPMQEVVKDSLYKAIITTETGYLFAEIKFTVNGTYELQNQPNRRVQFTQQDTTYYKATFNLNQ
jgi:hypothetical protein